MDPLIPDCPFCGTSTMEEMEDFCFNIETFTCRRCRCEFTVTALRGDDPVYEILVEGLP